MPHEKLISVGHVTRAHGIRGELRIACGAESPHVLRPFVLLRQSPAAIPQKHSVLGLRMHQGDPLLTLEGVPDRTAAELLRGREVLIPGNRLPALSDSELYLHQLQGLSVIHVQENGRESHLGSLANISTQAGQELWSITTPDGREILFPAVPEFVADIDLDAKTVRITPPPGLVELYLE